MQRDRVRRYAEGRKGRCKDNADKKKWTAVFEGEGDGKGENPPVELDRGSLSSQKGLPLLGTTTVSDVWQAPSKRLAIVHTRTHTKRFQFPPADVEDPENSLQII